MLENTNVKTLREVVVRFSGDSGDGMQLAGNVSRRRESDFHLP